eukprot:3594880-Pleurochrysis_carterae.AAC.1
MHVATVPRIGPTNSTYAIFHSGPHPPVWHVCALRVGACGMGSGLLAPPPGAPRILHSAIEVSAACCYPQPRVGEEVAYRTLFARSTRPCAWVPRLA